MISPVLQELLQNHGTNNLTVVCNSGQERARVLELLRNFGCNINDGRDRTQYITNPDYDLCYHSPRFYIYGNVSCRGGDKKNLGPNVIRFDEFMEYVYHDFMDDPITPPDLGLMAGLLS